MPCPICSGWPLSVDVSKADARGTKMRVQGRVYAAPELDLNLEKRYGTTPMSDYFSVTLRSRNWRHIYLKFPTRLEMNQWQSVLAVGTNVECQGCFHTVDGKGILVDITYVQRLDAV